MPQHQNTFLFGSNATFIAELYARFLQDPSGVDESWQDFFKGLNDDSQSVLAELNGPGWAAGHSRVIGTEEASTAGAKSAKGSAPAGGNGVRPAANGKSNGAAAEIAARAEATPAALDDIRRATGDSIRALMLIRSYRVRGHLKAKLDPLGLMNRHEHPELDPKTYGFTDADLDRTIYVDRLLGLEQATLRQIVDILQQTYCGPIGVEYMHIQDSAEKAWIQERVEGVHNQPEFTNDGKRTILERLTAAETFERFLDKRYTGTKRFGLEGGEALIPALEEILRRGGKLGMKELVVGMPHRGRLNVLANFMGKKFAAIFSEFQGNSANPEDVQGSGDVKYHLGTSSDREFDGNSVHLSLTANPSHLEAVDPVVLGKVRAKQKQRGDAARKEVVGLLMHGDAAFAGQGLVAECLELSELKGYRTGGTIHVIVNNQIGFTTSPAYSRSGPYASDLAKSIQSPIFHVNGDNPEAVAHVARIATEFRYQFGKDVVIDLFCYRRHGHNESDEPAFTQPLMYKAIANHPTTREIYVDRLVREGVVSAEAAQNMVTEFQSRLEQEFESAKSYRPNKADWLEGAWAGLEAAPNDDRRGSTAVSMELLSEVGQAISSVPDGFDVHRKIARQLAEKRKLIETGEGIDWATGEALALGTLAAEGNAIRLSGQDSGRGTFSQRHAVLVDQTTEKTYIPLSHVREGQAAVEIIDSPLSEAAVLGFDYGYSLAEPNALVLWEAQFGDFANGAQVIIDQFLSSSEAKWLRMSGLVMLLPHGYEGMGPEHSSARLERFLQLSGEDNLQVCNLTTPANYFHALRRQVRRKFRKPLVIMSPKSLLRHKQAVSRLDEMGPGTTFHRVIEETEALVGNSEIRRVVLCSGKLYYDLLAGRTERAVKDVALVRVEQLHPFPFNAVGKVLAQYPHAEIVWAQEEPANMGGWSFVDRRIETVLSGFEGRSKRARYIGRPESASPATGLLKRHNQEQARIVEEAFTAA